MKVLILIPALAMTVSPALADSPLQAFNAQGHGTVSGRVQYLGMYRDFDNGNNGNNGHASTLGFILGYVSPQWHGLDAGVTYNYAGMFASGGNSALVTNDGIRVFNEAWGRVNLAGAGLPGTALVVGRKISNGEVFRADDFRQKSRSIQALQLETRDIPALALTVGHAEKMSNWVDVGDRWEFNDFGEVFGVGYDTDGITWAEGVYTGIDRLELALFDAYAWDVANLAGARVKYRLSESSALTGHYRHEESVGDAADRSADAYSLGFEQKFAAATVEPGWFGVRGDDLRFQETTTGINHPLGLSLMIYPSMFAGDTDTVYVKGTTKLGNTALYALYSYTWHDDARYPYDAQELDVVVKQSLTKEFSVSVKLGYGTRESTAGGDDTTATDARLFVTYAF